MSFLSSWRTALRVARREVRRTKGRSALVIAMIALPVLFLAFAAVSYDMFTLTPGERADRTMGTGTARISWTSREPMVQMPDPQQGAYSGGGLPTAQVGPPAKGDPVPPPTQADLIAALPPGSTVLPVRRGAVTVRVPDGIGGLDAVSVDASGPLTMGFVTLLAGRVPSAASEVALSDQAMRRLGVSLGGRMTLADGVHQYTVVGQVEFPSLLTTVALFAPIGADHPDALSFTDDSWLVKTPKPVSWADVLAYNRLGMLVTSRAVLADPPPADQIQYTLPQGSFVDAQAARLTVLIAGLALLEIVLMAGPAFAVSARRRQRQLALVAANGGTPAQVRRIVLADGVVLGGFGAVLGIGSGIATAFLGRPLLEEQLAHARAGGYRVFPLALLGIAALAVLTGVLAALVPAFITARQNIIASLAGRRGVLRSRKRWLAVGLATCVVGAGVVYLGTSKVDTSIILAGLILGELGLVLCTPSLVGLIARLGRVLPLGPRIALRDAARNRAAAAPAISAVMAAVAGSVAIGLYLSSSVAQQQASYTAQIPTGYAEVQIMQRDPTHPVGGDPVAAIEAVLRSTLPVTDIRRIDQPACPVAERDTFVCALSIATVPALSCPYATTRGILYVTGDDAKAAWADPRCRDVINGDYGLAVDDGSGVAALTGASGDDLSRAQATLRAGGVVVRDARYIDNGMVTVDVMNHDTSTGKPYGPDSTLRVPGYLLTTGIGHGRAIVAPSLVTRAGLATQVSSLVAVTSRMPSQSEQDKMHAQLQAEGQDAAYVEAGAPIKTDVRILVLLVAAAAITLAAAGVATALAAADGRQDLSTLAAVGASPRVRRGLSLSQSGVIAGLGSVLGALAGTVAAIAIIEVLNHGYTATWPGPSPLPIALPWLNLAVALLVVPALAMLGAGTLTRSRLPIERRL